MHHRKRKIRPIVRALLSLALLAAVSTAPVFSQSSTDSGASGRVGESGPSAYGTDDVTITVVPASTCLPANDQASGLNVEYSTNLQGWVWKTGGTANLHDFICPVSLPSGARLEQVLLEACDTVSPSAVTLLLNRCDGGSDSACTNLGSVSTGTSGTPGCSFFSIASLPATTINNFTTRYNLFVQDTGSTSATKFRSIELWWRRQVSPAPATATFGDVPTGHLFFKHVEALAEAGITGGCGGGDFCPNDAVTRGQMAAFLAKALGLHWAP